MKSPQLIDLLDSLESAGPERAREFWEPKAEAEKPKGQDAMSVYQYYRSWSDQVQAAAYQRPSFYPTIDYGPITTDPGPVVWEMPNFDIRIHNNTTTA
jgi:hypothetical protein